MKGIGGIFIADIKESGIGRNWVDLLFRDAEGFRKYCKVNVDKTVVVEIKPKSKTTEKILMYSYYQKAIIPATILALTDDGFTGVDEVVADAYLKQSVAQLISINHTTGKTIPYAEDKHNMTKERLHKYLSDCIYLLEERHGRQVIDSQEYKTGFKNTK